MFNIVLCLLLQEDQDAMEVDLDKDEVVRAEGDEQSGEKMLAEYTTVAKPRRRVSGLCCVGKTLIPKTVTGEK